MRTARTFLLAAALAALAAGVAGCGTDCGDLAKRICNCSPVGASRDTCNNTVSTQLTSSDKPSAADEAYCKAKLTATGPDGGLPPPSP